MNIIDFRKQLETTLNKHQDIIKADSDELINEYAIPSSQSLKDALQKIEDKDRLLQIGIIGRVKAGKSSLLNAMLFHGKSILPKAATPMTAALTVISYGPELSATVEFFTPEDLENIKKESDQYEQELNTLIQQKIHEKSLRNKLKDALNPKEIRANAERAAKQELKDEHIKQESAQYEQELNTRTQQKIEEKSLRNKLKDVLNPKEIRANAERAAKQELKDEHIKQESAQYEQELNTRTQEKIDEKSLKNKIKDALNPKKIRAKAECAAKRDLKSKISLSAAYDQYERIQKTGVEYTSLEDKKTLVAPSLSELSEQLLEYVGAEGKYMPFTKSVHIKIPQKNLENIQIVDTPGVNDPVQSREERTRELLKFCDVVLIVSPSGQFLSNEDIELMDRITSKEGIRELYVVASQVDIQLFGSIKRDNEGNLYRACKGIISDLAEHLHSTLSTLKANNPEVGTTYDQLIEQSQEKVIHSSGICVTIKEGFDHQAQWDSGTQTAWNNLTTHYPDYFSDSDKTLSFSNLDLLANMCSINSIIETVKAKKDGILRTRTEEFVKAKSDSLFNYKKALLRYIAEQIEHINNGNLEVLKKEQQLLLTIQKSVAPILNEEYLVFVGKLEKKLQDKMTMLLQEYVTGARNSVNDTEENQSESYEASTSKWWNLWSWGKTETRINTYITVRTGAVRDVLKNMTDAIETTVEKKSTSLLKKWKKKLYTQLLKTLRSQIKDEKLDPTRISQAIRIVVNSVVYPDISYSGELPSNLSAIGTLTGNTAEEFVENAKTYISNWQKRVKKDIKDYVSNLETVLEAVTLSDRVFGHYNSKLEELNKHIRDKAIVLEKFKKLRTALEQIN